jgi:hypothetical protein
MTIAIDGEDLGLIHFLMLVLSITGAVWIAAKWQSRGSVTRDDVRFGRLLRVA